MVDQVMPELQESWENQEVLAVQDLEDRSDHVDHQARTDWLVQKDQLESVVIVEQQVPWVELVRSVTWVLKVLLDTRVPVEWLETWDLRDP